MQNGGQTEPELTERGAISGAEFSDMYESVMKIINQTGRIILGKKEIVKMLVISLLSQGHVLIEDVPGVGKTTLAHALAKSIGLKFKRAQFTPDLMPSDITGFTVYNKSSGEFEYKEGLAICNILLADEINRTSPKTQSALLEVMEEATVTVDGVTHNVPIPFMVIATQNPTGFVGTHPLPEAQLDRFIMRISIGYPAVGDEVNIISSRQAHNPLDEAQAVITAQDLLRAQDTVKKIYIDRTLYKFIVDLVSKTRSNPSITLGASPRASLALMRLAQANAFLSKRDYVTPDDISLMYIPAIEHRIMLSQDAKLQKVKASQILSEIKLSVPTPIAVKQ